MEIKALWDREVGGWYFKAGEHEGIIPSQQGLDNLDTPDLVLEEKAKYYASWCGLGSGHTVTVERTV